MAAQRKASVALWESRKVMRLRLGFVANRPFAAVHRKISGSLALACESFEI
jgi:hypothetical protein